MPITTLLSADRCLRRRARGTRFMVAVEYPGDEWIEMMAHNERHARHLATHVVDHGAMGASCRLVDDQGVPKKYPFFTRYAEPDDGPWEDFPADDDEGAPDYAKPYFMPVTREG